MNRDTWKAIAATALVFGGAGVSISALLLSLTQDQPTAPLPIVVPAPVYDCKLMDADVNIHNLCEQSSNCTYTHAELKTLVYRVAQCKIADLGLKP